MNRREFIKTAAVLTAASISSSFAPTRVFSKAQSPKDADSNTERIGYLPITDATPLLIAHARGYFEDEGLKVQQPTMIRNWSSLSESFLAGKFNLAHLLLPIPIWMRYNIKAPIKIVAWNHTNGSALTVGANSHIKDFSDLGGKQIAVPYWYSMHNIILQMGLRKYGLKPRIQSQSIALKPDEVNLFILPPPEMPLALAGRKIHGYIVAEPFNALAELKIKAKIMRFTGDIWKNHPCCVAVMHEETIRSRPVFSQKVVNAVVRAQLWTLNNREQTAKILSKQGKGYLPAPYDVLLRTFTGYNLPIYNKGALPRAIKHPEWKVSRIGFQPYPYPSATRFILDEMKNTLMEGNINFLKSLDNDHVVKDLFDYNLVKNAINNAGGPGKFTDMDIQTPWERQEIIDF